MARNHVELAVPPEAAWALLEDPYAYPRWVVGADRTVEADASWPAPGSSFRVRLAFGHVDTTTVRELAPGRRIVLDAASSFLGPARVTMELEPGGGGGTQVTMIEDPAGKLTPMRFLPPVHLAIKLRNVESLRRFKRIAESA